MKNLILFSTYAFAYYDSNFLQSDRILFSYQTIPTTVLHMRIKIMKLLVCSLLWSFLIKLVVILYQRFLELYLLTMCYIYSRVKSRIFVVIFRACLILQVKFLNLALPGYFLTNAWYIPYEIVFSHFLLIKRHEYFYCFYWFFNFRTVLYKQSKNKNSGMIFPVFSRSYRWEKCERGTSVSFRVDFRLSIGIGLIISNRPNLDRGCDFFSFFSVWSRVNFAGAQGFKRSRAAKREVKAMSSDFSGKVIGVKSALSVDFDH